jgi:hypothetical protein
MGRHRANAGRRGAAAPDGANAATWPQGKAEEYQQLQTQRRNREAQYDQLCATYEARWSDEWRGIPAPDDLPQRCPSLP